MEKEGFEWNRLAGTSAGAIIASLIAVGYSGEELKKIMSELDYSKLLYKDSLQGIPLLGKTLGILFKKGYYKTNKIEEWLRSLYKAKGKTKFKDLYKNNASRLKIIASDVSDKSMITFPDDLIEYGHNPYEFDIARAVSMSISIPIFFSPQILSYKKEKNFVVDGGIYSNFPIWIFDDDNIPKHPTIGFKFDNGKNNTKQKHNTMAYYIDLFESVIETVDEEYIKYRNNARTITIPSFDIKATRFDITPSECEKLYLSGFNRANEFLRSEEFKKYIGSFKEKTLGGK
jgi:NTE family protein